MAKVLVACEFSGVVASAFRQRGHEAWSCDLEASEFEYHIQGDVTPLLDQHWDLVIAHPPCTYLCNSGVRHLSKKIDGGKIVNFDRWQSMKAGTQFFNLFKNCKSDKVAIENPIPHGYALADIGASSQIIHPWMFGHKERKATCLWLKNLPKLVETNNVKNEMMLLPKKEQQRIHYLPKSKDRGKKRSITFTGIADAMADQWGQLL